ncbi:FH2 domain-containing protein 1-like [Thalassophryne amazonica]|uniref:FH2 domain-containing protein 1-like n=1 Tax=Thalassophryne amazonica TaxID=390379 RepID=UPI001472380C|nr:FH2 domain-containing protein 1-like [Thalassophryne amazonica]
MGISAMGKGQCSNMRSFNWETLPKHSVIGKHNIWTEEGTQGEYELDTDRMKELFSRKQGQQQLKAQSMRGLTASASKGEMVSINPQSQEEHEHWNFLKQFKWPVKDMIEAIQSGNGPSFGSGKLRELCKLLPDESEMKDMIGFKGDPSALPEADLFMLMLIKIPSYEERLNGLVLKEEFFPFMDEMKTSIAL